MTVVDDRRRTQRPLRGHGLKPGASGAPTRLREIRTAAGLSVAEIRDGLRERLPRRHVPAVSTLSRVETGQIRTIDFVLLCALSQVLECSLDDLSVDASDDYEQIRELVLAASEYEASQAASS